MIYEEKVLRVIDKLNDSGYDSEREWAEAILKSIGIGPEYDDNLINRLRRENQELRDKLSNLKVVTQTYVDKEYCATHGHDWLRHPYCGIGDVNFLTCQRCGAETTD